MRRLINSDDLREQFDIKWFRGIALFIAGIAASRAIAFLLLLPGMWVLGLLAWLIWLALMVPNALVIYTNYQRGDHWFEGMNPDSFIWLLITAAFMVTGLGLELYRAGVM